MKKNNNRYTFEVTHHIHKIIKENGKASPGNDCQTFRDLERMLMPQDMKECIRKAPRSGHCRRQLTDPLSQSLRLFNVCRGTTINVINGNSSRQNRIFQRREEGSRELSIDAGYSF